MSDYGLKILNDNGEIQIDSKYRNLSKVEESTCIVKWNKSAIAYASNGWNMIDLNASLPEFPVIAFTPQVSAPTQLVSLVLNASSGNYKQMIFHCEYMASPLDDQLTVPYILFTEKNAVLPSNDYGLIIYNASSNICFSSEERYLKIVGVTEQTSLDVLATTSISVSNADDNYFILTPPSFVEIHDGGTPGAHYNLTLGMQNKNASTIKLDWISVKSSEQSLAATHLNYLATMNLIEISY